MNRPSRSRRLLTLGGLAGTLLAAGLGCSQNNALVRGQSPDGVGTARAADLHPASAPIFRSQNPDAPRPSHKTRLVSHEGAAVSGGMVAGDPAIQYGPMGGGACPPGACPPGYCPPGGCPGVCMPGIPVPGACAGLCGSTYSYRDPGCPVYPPGTGPGLTGPGSPGAVVQYPYYTTKGPDDFFLDQDGRF